MIVAILLCLAAYTYQQDMPDLKFPDETPVIMLDDQNWDSITRLGHETISQPWFIFFWAPWCKGCHRIVPIWEDMFRRYNESIKIGAIDGYNQELICDRIGVTKYPTFVFFDTDNQMYFYNETTNMDNFTYYVDQKLYKYQEAYEIPIEIDHFKKWLRRIFSLKMIPVYIVVSFIVVLTSICIYGDKQEKNEKVDAKNVRLEIQRRKLERDECESLLKRKRE